MKVLQVNKLYSPWVGGVEKVAQDIAEGLKSSGTDCEVLVCVPKGRAVEDIVDGIAIHRASSWGMALGMPLSLDFFRKFRRLAKDADLIFLHHPFPLGFLAYLWFGKKKRMVVWYHSDILRQKISGFLFRPFLNAVLGRAEKIFVSGDGIKDNSQALKSYNDKCVVVPFGMDLSPFADPSKYAPDVEAIKKQFPGKIVLSIGRLVPYKGYEYLIRAMKDVDAKLLIMGGGPLRFSLERLIEESNLKGKVFLLGNIENKFPYFFAADLFALPSVMPTEAFGLVQIEALAAGVPVINTNLPTAVPEVSRDGETGFTVPPRDSEALCRKMNEILEDQELRKKFQVAAKERAFREFSREKFIDRLEKVLGGNAG